MIEILPEPAVPGMCGRCGLSPHAEGRYLCTGCEWHQAAEGLGEGTTVTTEWGVHIGSEPWRDHDFTSEKDARAFVEGWGEGAFLVARRVIVGPWEER